MLSQKGNLTHFGMLYLREQPENIPLIFQEQSVLQCIADQAFIWLLTAL